MRHEGGGSGDGRKIVLASNEILEFKPREVFGLPFVSRNTRPPRFRYPVVFVHAPEHQRLNGLPGYVEPSACAVVVGAPGL